MPLKWTNDYGPIVRFGDLFNAPRIILSDPASIQHMLGKAVYTYVKPPLPRAILESTTGVGLLVAEGMEHKRQRKYLQSIFSYKYIKRMAPDMFVKAQELVAKWKRDVEQNSQVIVDEDVSHTALNIIGSAGFGYEFDAHAEEKSPLSEAYSVLTNYPRGFSMVLGFRYKWMRPLLSHFRKVNKAEQVVDEVVRNLIRTRQQEMLQGHVDGTDVLTVLLRESMADGTQLTETELISQVMTVAIAGHETTAAGITWAMYALANHPHVQDKLRAEIIQHFPTLDSAPTSDQLNQLDYLDMVIKEVLRLHCPVPAIMRYSDKDDTLPNGVFIPKGTQVEPYTLIMHTLKQYWGDDADEFNPERWTTNISDMPNFTHVYFPFSAGVRTCIGMKLALLELKMVLVSVLHAFKLEPVPGHKVSTTIGLALRPSPYVLLNLKLV
jgi:cytochrome P450